MPPPQIGTLSNRPKKQQASIIKPHLKNLSSSGTMLNGIIVERNIETGNNDIDSTAESPSKHVIVLHSSDPARLEWKIDGKLNDSAFKSGDTIINPFGLFVAPRWSKDVELILLAINPALVNRIADQMGYSSKTELIPRFRFRDAFLQQLIINLISEFENEMSPQQADLVYLESLTHTLITHLLRKYSVEQNKQHNLKHGLPPRKLARVIEYINDNLDKPLTLESLSKIADLSPSYFVSLFRQSTGQPPHKYILNQRVSKAKNLLVKTNKPIADIALETGFSDQSHLTRIMRRDTGMTPKIFRTG